MLLIFLVFYAVLLYVFTLWVPCSDVGYDFRIKTMFGLFLSQVVCRRAHVLLCFCACLRIVMSNILSYQMSLHSEFRVAMSATISAWERYSVGLFPKLFVRLLMSYLCYLCLFVNSNVQHTLTIWVTWRVHWEKHDCLILAAGALRDRDFLILAAGALREAGTVWSWRRVHWERQGLLDLGVRLESVPLLVGPVLLIFQFFCIVCFACLSLSCVLCTQCCQFLWIVHSWSPFRFSLTLIYHYMTPIDCFKSKLFSPVKSSFKYAIHCFKFKYLVCYFNI